MGKHSSAPQPSSNATTPAAITSSTAPLPTTTTKDGVEVYGTPTTTSSNTSAVNPVTAVAAATPVKVKEEDLHDAEDAVIAIGSKCKRPSCKAIYSSSSSSSAEECVFHSGEPVFHEGSKVSFLCQEFYHQIYNSSKYLFYQGWSCCSRKVLEFDEFLKIEGCKRAKHRFTDPKLPGEEEEFVECRHDWYQTQTSVIISVFAKKLDKQKVNVVFEENEVMRDREE